ncbi:MULTISPECIES: thermonuclease family protein [unclassified Streptomyces]|uniref:thermonuclease family protein n=1 Tax=unclassified Streptomyces TaxID=2593676 RepID=UPI000AB2A726|nr:MULTISPECIES: thermonuclease family protein [unclassified Streptomyces]
MTALLVVLVLVLGLGGLGALIGENPEPTRGTAAPTPLASTTQPSDQPGPDEPAGRTTPPAGRSEGPAVAPTTKPPPRTTAPAGGVVLRIIDGDTLEVRGDGRILPKDTVSRVRLLQIDTPERGACFADEATARTTALLPPGSRFRAERDVELTDRHHRHLLYVWNERGTFVNESLVRGGHAEAVLYPPNDRYWSKISAAEEAAQRTGAGLWTACAEQPEATTAPSDPPDPPAPRAPSRPDLPDGPPAGAPDVDCADLPGPVWVGEDDPHRLDRDGDGIGCEAN